METQLFIESLESRELLAGDTHFESTYTGYDQQNQPFQISYVIDYNGSTWNYHYETDKQFDYLALQTKNGPLVFNGKTLDFQSNFGPEINQFTGQYHNSIINTSFVADFLNVNPGTGISYVLNGNAAGTTAGQFNWQDHDGNTFSSFCIELTQYTGSNITFTYQNANNSLKELFGRIYSTVDTPDEYAALQMSIWEIINDPTDFNLSSGNFKVTDQATIKQLAQSWLDQLNGDSNFFSNNVYVIHNANNQDQVLYKDVPEYGVTGLILSVGETILVPHTPIDPGIPINYPIKTYISIIGARVPNNIYDPGFQVKPSDPWVTQRLVKLPLGEVYDPMDKPVIHKAMYKEEKVEESKPCVPQCKPVCQQPHIGFFKKLFGRR